MKRRCSALWRTSLPNPSSVSRENPRMLKTLAAFIFGDLRLKVFALAIAVAVWFYASGRIRQDATIPVPLTVTAPQNHEIIYQSERRVVLQFVGPRSLIERLKDIGDQGELQMVTALTPEQSQGSRVRLEVKREWLEVRYWLGMSKSELSELRVAAVQPDHVDVYASAVKLDTRPVHVQLSGQPPQGYEIRETAATPPQVTVTAPALLLEQLTAVSTTEISVSYRRSDFSRDPVALVLQEQVQLEEGLVVPISFECSPARVTVDVVINAARAEQRQEGVPVDLLQPADFPYEVEIAPEYSKVSVVVSGTAADLAKLTPGSIAAYVNLKALSTEKIEPGRSAPYKVNVELQLPEDVPDIEARPEPKEITVTLRNP